MPRAVRKGDIGSAHDCFPSSPAIEGSDDVFINGQPAMRVGDAYAAHGCGACAPHGRKAITGSASVLINGRPAVRVGDSIDCGGTAETGSPNVFIGDLSWDGQTSLPVRPKLRLLLVRSPGINARPYTLEPYELYHDGALVQKGNTDEEGVVEYAYDPPWSGTLKVKIRHREFDYAPSVFVPVEDEAGSGQRLDTLGFYNTHGAQEDVQTQTKPQVKYFQGTVGLDADNKFEEDLAKTLKPLMP